MLGQIIADALSLMGRLTESCPHRLVWSALVALTIALTSLAAPAWLALVILLIGSLPLVLHIVASRFAGWLLVGTAETLNSPESKNSVAKHAFWSFVEEMLIVLMLVTLLAWTVF